MKSLVNILLLLFILGCRSNDPDPLVVGSWRWTGSSGGLFGMLVKPRPNEHIILAFEDGNSLAIYQNDSLYFTAKYHLTTTGSIHSGKGEKAIEIKNWKRKQAKKTSLNYYLIGGKFVIMKLDESSLRIDDNRHDGYGSDFERVK